MVASTLAVLFIAAALVIAYFKMKKECGEHIGRAIGKSAEKWSKEVTRDLLEDFTAELVKSRNNLVELARATNDDAVWRAAYLAEQRLIEHVTECFLADGKKNPTKEDVKEYISSFEDSSDNQ